MDRKQNPFGNGEFINNTNNPPLSAHVAGYALGDGNTFTDMVNWFVGSLDPQQYTIYNKAPINMSGGPFSTVRILVTLHDGTASQYVWTASVPGQAVYRFQCTWNGLNQDPSDVAITAQDIQGKGIAGTWTQSTP